MNVMFKLLATRVLSGILAGVISKPALFYVNNSLSFCHVTFTVLHAFRVGTSIFCIVAYVARNSQVANVRIIR